MSTKHQPNDSRLKVELSDTLQKAINELRSIEDPDKAVTVGMSMETADAFDMHDTVHILFRCGTSLEDEIAAHAWMKFATTAKIREMHRAVAQDEHRNMLASVGHANIARTWLRMLPQLGRIYWRSRRMKKRIDFSRLSEIKQQRIDKILQEHGIAW